MTDDLPQTLQTSEGEHEWEGPDPDLGRRRIERARQDHEEAFERLLARCRRLEDEKVDWTGRSAAFSKDIEALTAARMSSEEGAAELARESQALHDRLREGEDRFQREAADRLRESEDRLHEVEDRFQREAADRLREAADRLQESENRLHEAEDRFQREAADRLGEVEGRHRDALAAAERESLDLQRRIADIEGRHRAAAASWDEADLAAARTYRAERDRMGDAHAEALAEVETREETARHRLVKAEQGFRIEAYRLSTLVMLKSKEAEVATAEAEAARLRLAIVVASNSWRLTRPLRVLARFVRRAGRAPRRLARVLRSRS